jgi:hypothetical protein
MLRSALIAVARAATVVAVGSGTAGTAAAAEPCWRTVINDWYNNGQIDSKYSVQCYRQVLDHLTPELKIYSDLPDKVQRALQAAERGRALSVHTPKSASADGKSRRPIDRVLNELGPSRADSLPIPLLILAGVALLLIAAGAVSFTMRRLHNRRPPSGPGA